MNNRNIDRITLLAFFTSTMLGGLNAIGVRYTVLELPPFWGAALRFAPAALLLFLLARLRRLPLPAGRGLLGAVLYGALNFGASYIFFYWGLQVAPPGISQVMLALVPLLTLFISVAYRQERLTLRALSGALLAVAGVALVFGSQAQADIPFVYLMALVGGTVCFAWANVVYKNYPAGHPISTNAIAMAVGAAILLVTSFLFAEPHRLPVQAQTWAALAYLIVIGSCVVFILALFVLNRWTASATSYVFVLLPFVTVTVSAALGQERLTLTMLAGAVLVIAGVYVGAIRRTKPPLQARPASHNA